MEYFRCSASTQATVAFIVCQHGQASDAMLTYTSAELRSLAGHTQPPPRNVRKTVYVSSVETSPAGHAICAKAYSTAAGPRRPIS